MAIKKNDPTMIAGTRFLRLILVRPFMRKFLHLFILLSSGLFAQRLEETDAAFTYNGTWTPTTDASASGGTLTMSAAAGSTITFNTTGRNFAIYRKIDPNGGSATITIDGNNFGSILFFFQETRWQVPAVFDNLPDGPHKVVLTVDAARDGAPGGLNVYFDAAENPALLTPTQSQTDAVTRTNFHRNLMGLPPVSHNLALGLAADAHARYLNNVDFIANNMSPHIETYGADPAFTGASPSDRNALFSSTNFGGVEDANNSEDPIQFVDGWMDGVYHRGPFIVYGLTEVGFGGYSKGSAIDFGVTRPQTVLPTANSINTYPADGQTDVWISYDGTDGPNTIQFGRTYGYPISLMVTTPAGANPGTTAAAPTTGTLTDAAGTAVPVTLFDSTRDGQVPGYLMIPNVALTPATTYTARMTGVSEGNAFDRTWKFTTSVAHAVHGLRAVPGNNSYVYSINFETAGAGAAAEVEWGPTTAYGTKVAATLSNGTTGFRTRIGGLRTVPLINYRVTSKDAQGNIYQSPNRTIRTVNPLAAATVGFVTVQPSQASVSFRFETVGAVTSAVIQYGPTTDYGSKMTATLFDGTTTLFFGDIDNLTSGSYRYQIVATDAQGNTFSTPDAEFIIP